MYNSQINNRVKETRNNQQQMQSFFNLPVRNKCSQGHKAQGSYEYVSHKSAKQQRCKFNYR